jgi:G3E family GTPase
MIRSFPEHPEFSGYFLTGKLSIAYDPEQQGITISVESMSHDIIISVRGIMAGENTEQFIVNPGEAEQDIPSFKLCSAVFELLVSSLSYHAGTRPSALKLHFYPGRKGYFDDTVLRHEQSGADITFNTLSALFTDNSEAVTKFLVNTGAINCLRSVTWADGMSDIPGEFINCRFFNSENINSTSLNRQLLGIEIKPPLYVVSGFLGSGKTTFIKNFLEFQAQKYLFGAVIQNELGETGLDGKLISDECRVVEMDEGCVCCSLSGNLRKGINKIVSEFVPDFILLETTGAANPMNLISEIHELRDIVKFDSVTTIVDSANIIEALRDYDIAKDQLKAADIIILNKTDFLGPQQLEDIKKKVTGINPRAVTAQAEFGRINPSLLYDTDTDFPGTNPSRQFTVHSHMNHSTVGLSALTITLPQQVMRESFLDKIKSMPFDIFRIKGFIKFHDNDDTLLFQYVAGRYELFPGGNIQDKPFIVLIGRDVDSPGIRDYFRF